ncbi:hypothetical protein DIURU_000610 [Diutina rugosa]|uniref:Ubiquitin carboxyl-terminal hydrolase n=1 Tax=Diutina rugosa TaxID=5481 RepID=A0A642UXP9_DIURU|nr:uncharacterized protein DIURU_000610 [Diutina rugosa]KAA8907290.1 hypothetical protein DIURU_000610 [Diutina rugosa]
MTSNRYQASNSAANSKPFVPSNPYHMQQWMAAPPYYPQPPFHQPYPQMYPMMMPPFGFPPPMPQPAPGPLSPPPMGANPQVPVSASPVAPHPDAPALDQASSRFGFDNSKMPPVSPSEESFCDDDDPSFVYLNCTRAEFNARDLESRRRRHDQVQTVLKGTPVGMMLLSLGEDVTSLNKPDTPPQPTTTDVPSTSSPSPSTTQPQITNWASVLHQNKPTPKKTANGAAVAKSAPYTPLSPAPEFDLSLEAQQSLGVILLRVMHDPNYSVLNQPNSLPKFEVKPHGLTNPGNICYMNSIIQVLAYCRPFNQLLRLIHDKSMGSLGQSTTPVLDATICIFTEFSSQEHDIISPERFFQVLSDHPRFSHLQWGQQEDAEEFLGYFLDTLNDEFIAAIGALRTPTVDSLIQQYAANNSAEATKRFSHDVKFTMRQIRGQDKPSVVENEWNEVGKKNVEINRNHDIKQTPITMIFGGVMRSEVVSHKSASAKSFKKSVTLDPLQHMQLDLDQASSVEETLLKWNEPEQIVLDPSDHSSVVKKQNFIDKLPHTLIIHLKRFSFAHDGSGNVIEKLRQMIRFGYHLEIPSALLSAEAKHQQRQYRLVGVVYHHGLSAANGHYTCDVATPQWVRVDDTLVTSLAADEVLDGGDDTRNAYILVYEQEA